VTEQIPFENRWNGTIPTACVSSPPAPPTTATFTLDQVKSLNIASGIWLTLYSYMCQAGGPTTPQYALRYTRVAGKGYVYADYMLAKHAPLP
jgi:hypothetical protein